MASAEDSDPETVGKSVARYRFTAARREEKRDGRMVSPWFVEAREKASKSVSKGCLRASREKSVSIPAA